MLNEPFGPSISGLMPCPGRWRAGVFGRSTAGQGHLCDGAPWWKHVKLDESW